MSSNQDKKKDPKITAERDDGEILKYNVSKLKQYIVGNNSRYNEQTNWDRIKDKNHLRFIALDSNPTGWTKKRLNNLDQKFKIILFEEKIPDFDKNKKDIFLSTTSSTQKQEIINEIYKTLNNDNNNSNSSHSHNGTTTNGHHHNNDNNKNNDDEKTATNNDNKRITPFETHHDDMDDDDNDDQSSVSTHESMPSLMSDDESDDDDGVSGDEGSESSDDDGPNNHHDRFDDDHEEKHGNKLNSTTNGKKTNKKKNEHEDFLSNWTNNAKKKNKKKKQNKKKQQQQNNNNSKQTQTKKNDKNDKTPKDPPKITKEKEKEKEKEKDSKSEIIKKLKNKGFSMDKINKIKHEMNDSSDINEWIKKLQPTKNTKTKSDHGKNEKNGSTKLSKLTKKEKEKEKETKQQPLESKNDELNPLGLRLMGDVDAKKNAEGKYFLCIGARKSKVVIDERYLKCNVSLKLKLKKKGKKKPFHEAILIKTDEDNESLRDQLRMKLKIGYENVLSFDLTPNHYLMEFKKNDVKQRVNMESAFKQYQKNKDEKKKEKTAAKLVKDGFPADDAKKAIAMSMNNDIDSNSGNKKTTKKKTKNKQKKKEKKTKNTQKETTKLSTKSASTSPNITASSSSSSSSSSASSPPFASPTKPPAKSSKPDDLTLELMNSVRLNQNILLSMVNDTEGDEMIKDFYVRLFWKKDLSTKQDKFRLYKVENYIDTKKQYQVNGVKLTKGIQVSYGHKISTNRLSNVSDSDFALKELNDWKLKMKKDNKLLPLSSTLINKKEDLIEIQRILKEDEEKKQSQSQSLISTPPITPTKKITITSIPSTPTPSPSIPPGFVPGTNNIDNLSSNASSASSTSSPISNIKNNNNNKMHLASTSFVGAGHNHNGHHNMNYNRYQAVQAQANSNLYLDSQRLNAHHQMSDTDRVLKMYYDAIDAGYKCFWVIPTAKEDTEYVAFLLAKTSKNDKHLDDGMKKVEDTAAKRGDSCDWREIREFQCDKNAKGGAWKCKGYLIDCKHKTSAYEISLVLQEFVATLNTNKKAKNYNFARRVLREFGKRYMDFLKLPSGKIPKNKNKPQGPKYDYTIGEPSIEAMSQKEIQIGEYDHGTILSSNDHNDDLQSVTTNSNSVASHNTHYTNTKYDDYQHMKMPYNNGHHQQPMPYNRYNHNQNHNLNDHQQQQPKPSIPPQKQAKPLKPSKQQRQKERPFVVGDRVRWNNKKYDIIVATGDNIMLQNDMGSQYVSLSLFAETAHHI